MKRTWKTLLAVTLACVLALPLFGGSALAVDLEGSNTLSVKPAGDSVDEEFKADIAGANVVVDLYQVAQAVKIPGVDSYTLKVNEAFADLLPAEAADEESEKAFWDAMTDETWRQLSQDAAKLLFTEGVDEDGDPTFTKNADYAPLVEGLKADMTAPEQSAGLPAGLYLIIARSAEVTDPTEYMTYETMEVSGEGETTAAAKNLVSKAESEEYAYTFLPELVSLPTKEAVDGVINTANPGEWIYDATVTLKPEQAPRKGSIKIVKGLEGFLNGKPATFVFEIKAVRKGEVVFSNVYSITFDGAGTQELLVEGIPLGSEVTVTEVYSGASYKLASSGEITQTLESVDIVPEFRFTNEPDRYRDGGAITNIFEYDEEGGWTWHAIPRQEGESGSGPQESAPATSSEPEPAPESPTEP